MTKPMSLVYSGSDANYLALRMLEEMHNIGTVDGATKSFELIVQLGLIGLLKQQESEELSETLGAPFNGQIAPLNESK